MDQQHSITDVMSDELQTLPMNATVKEAAESHVQRVLFNIALRVSIWPIPSIYRKPLVVFTSSNRHYRS